MYTPPDQTAQFESRGAHGYFGEGTDIGLVGEKEPVIDVAQRSRERDD